MENLRGVLIGLLVIFECLLYLELGRLFVKLCADPLGGIELRWRK